MMDAEATAAAALRSPPTASITSALSTAHRAAKASSAAMMVAWVHAVNALPD